MESSRADNVWKSKELTIYEVMHPAHDSLRKMKDISCDRNMLSNDRPPSLASFSHTYCFMNLKQTPTTLHQCTLQSSIYNSRARRETPRLQITNWRAKQQRQQLEPTHICIYIQYCVLGLKYSYMGWQPNFKSKTETSKQVNLLRSQDLGRKKPYYHARWNLINTGSQMLQVFTNLINHRAWKGLVFVDYEVCYS